MAYSASRLPSRFPVGTKFVIEGRRGGEGQVQVFSRYLGISRRDLHSAAEAAGQAQIRRRARQRHSATEPAQRPSNPGPKADSANGLVPGLA